MNRAKANSKTSSIALPSSSGVVAVSSLAANPLPPGLSQLGSKQEIQSTTSQAAPPGLVCPASALTDRHKPSIKLAQNSLILIASSFESDVSAKRLIAGCQAAYDARQLDTLRTISHALADHAKYKPIAAYYLGLAEMKAGAGQLSRAKSLLEFAADQAPSEYKAKALLSIGAVNGYQGNITDELDCYGRALKIQSDCSTRIELNRAVAFNYTLEREYQKALALLESLAPLVRAIARHNPRLYFDYLNNYAVNLQAVGRLKEALRLAAIVCASPLANVYHEWLETREEIQASIIEQEARATIIAAPQVQSEEKREKSKHQSEPLVFSLGPGISEKVLLLIHTGLAPVGLIISRLECCLSRRGPPSPFRM
jgi:tetratricopeptide (TPR) repeat protein